MTNLYHFIRSKMFITFRQVLILVILCLTSIGLFDYLRNHDENDCSMTYMFENPGLVRINMSPSESSAFPHYKLFLYCEGYGCERYKSSGATPRFNKVGHVPVIFITGNADSHMQVRSLASVALDKSKNSKKSKTVNFQYFTVSFNEELSALYGPVLQRQSDFTRHCIKLILELYAEVKPDSCRPRSVLVIGNSMGGVVARSLLIPSAEIELAPNSVHTILTQASPHVMSVVNFDQHINKFYDRVNSFWQNKSDSRLENVVLVSLYGGVRDILVRSGLANINKWKGNSPAAIFASQTVSMPHVWRSVDHRCMSWCRELVLATNRALFDLIDPSTYQLTENRAKRVEVFKKYFERGVEINSSEADLVFDSDHYQVEMAGSIEVIENSQFSNENRDKPKVYVFNVNLILASFQFDSVFAYTNVNSKNSFLLCKSVRTKSLEKTESSEKRQETKCKDFLDLLTHYGRLIPPYLETSRHMTLSTIHVPDLKKLISREKYQYLLVTMPASSSKNNQFVKFDFYMKSERIESNLEYRTRFFFKNKATGNVIFRRVYLPQLKHVWQAYDLNKITRSENSCEHHLAKNTNKKPLSQSCLMIQFYEPTTSEQLTNHNEHVYHSQSIHSKNRNLTLRLTESVRNVALTPYVDFLQFELKHLLLNSNDKSSSEYSTYEIELVVNWSAILGQFVRFYLPLVSSFFFLILAVYFAQMVSSKQRLTDQFFLLSRYNSNFSFHVVISGLVSSMTLILQNVPSLEIYFDDLHRLVNANISFSFVVVLILYWCAYGLINSACVVLSLIVAALKFLFLNRFAERSVLSTKTTFFLNLALLSISVVLCVYMSTLAHLSIFVFYLIQLAYKKCKANLASSCNLELIEAKLLFSFFLLMFNGPGLVVWAKSLETSGFKPMFAIIGDSGLVSAIFSILFYFLDNLVHAKFFKSETLSRIAINSLGVNCIVGFFYSITSIYRLSYFILLHLAFGYLVSMLREEKREIEDDGNESKKNK